jgi:hypothetical protein
MGDCSGSFILPFNKGAGPPSPLGPQVGFEGAGGAPGVCPCLVLSLEEVEIDLLVASG